MWVWVVFVFVVVIRVFSVLIFLLRRLIPVGLSVAFCEGFVNETQGKMA